METSNNQMLRYKMVPLLKSLPVRGWKLASRNLDSRLRLFDTFKIIAPQGDRNMSRAGVFCITTVLDF